MTENRAIFSHSTSLEIHIASLARYFCLLICAGVMSCNSNRHYIKFRSGFENYYCVKQNRKDNLKLLVFVEGIPHYSYTKIYARPDGEVTKIIIERDGSDFFQAVTEIRDNKYYFNEEMILCVDTVAARANTGATRVVYRLLHDEILTSRYCSYLTFPNILGFVRIDKPDDYIEHLSHKKILKHPPK